jgi:tellurite resistance protein
MVLPLPEAAAEIWIALAAIAFVCLVAAYALKALRFPQAVKEDLANPALVAFCATLPVGMTLLAGGLQPYAYQLALAIWWAGVVLLVALQLRMLWRLAAGGMKLAQVNGGWMIVFVGGIVVPGGGLLLGEGRSRCGFSRSPPALRRS